MARKWQWWGLLALVLALAVTAGMQRREVLRLRQTGQLYADKFTSMFPYTLRRVEFQSLPATLDQIGEAQGVEETIWLFKQAQTLAVAFTDDLLMLNDLRYSGPPLVGKAVQFGDYRYTPSTPEQDALQWQILKARLHTTLWAMERKFYLDEGVLQPSEREALRTIAQQARAVGEQVESMKRALDAPTPYGPLAAAREMDKLTPLLDQLHQLSSAYEASLPPLQFKPGGLYDRLYGTKPGGG